MKRFTPLATVVGAVPGALPPLIGWTAAGGSLASAAPWSLFLIMFVWQLPHFLAIAWLYRDDYARAGLQMLPVVDRSGVLTGGQAALWAATLVPVTQLPFLLRFASGTYAIAALVLGIALLVIAARFMFAPHRRPCAGALLRIDHLPAAALRIHGRGTGLGAGHSVPSTNCRI